ncbi:MAG TPA: hypothetical protein VN031_03460 [Candidatus Microsaccharimonas sp.]|nr:hypothetical protein [Candidatus Microsaccharimonas sp.]
MTPKRPTKSPTARKFLLLLFLILLVGLGVVYKERWNLYDWYKLRNYTAPAAVVQLASDDTMTPYARRVLYVNQPALEEKADFTQCASKGEQTIVLGCYHGFQNGIFVLSVTDPRLNGVEQVTTAHEMLHAAYDRLSSKERANIDSQLRDYFNHGLTDERVRQTIEAYRSTEPTELVNEMHSIFGTEVANLPAPLEQYYKRYFTDRSKITGYAAQYEAEFTSRQAAIKADDAQLTAWKSQIDSLKADLSNKDQALNAQSDQLQALKDSNNISAYNAGVPGYNNSVNVYNSEVAQLRSLIDQYNNLVNERNAIALEAQALTNEINSSVAPVGTK